MVVVPPVWRSELPSKAGAPTQLGTLVTLLMRRCHTGPWASASLRHASGTPFLLQAARSRVVTPMAAFKMTGDEPKSESGPC
jgi:hypothetical protein